VNIQEYISSGIIESYVLGVASEKDRLEFERLSAEYPELAASRYQFELSLEKQALANAVEPPAYIKENILSLIRKEKAGKVVTISPQKNGRKIRTRDWAVAASVILLLGCAYMLYTLYEKNQKLRQAIARSNDNIDRLEEKKRVMEESMIPPDYEIKPAKVIAPQQDVPPVFEVFWDSTSTHVYLLIKNLKRLQPGQRYELWSVTKGKYQDLGIFDPPNDDKLILKMNNVREADSFAITIVNSSK